MRITRLKAAADDDDDLVYWLIACYSFCLKACVRNMPQEQQLPKYGTLGKKHDLKHFLRPYFFWKGWILFTPFFFTVNRDFTRSFFPFLVYIRRNLGFESEQETALNEINRSYIDKTEEEELGKHQNWRWKKFQNIQTIIHLMGNNSDNYSLSAFSLYRLCAWLRRQPATVTRVYVAALETVVLSRDDQFSDDLYEQLQLVYQDCS